MLPYLVSYYGNPHSRTHAYGWETEAAIEKARKVSAEFVYAKFCVCFRREKFHLIAEYLKTDLDISGHTTNL